VIRSPSGPISPRKEVTRVDIETLEQPIEPGSGIIKGT
jgi:hypothetical protein